ncbi:hypothetical protein RZS08_03810, partial [Arthrospira platensis SPKY1]|nr:hypothetical protein [Arthrospira platensis SPKY1]
WSVFEGEFDYLQTNRLPGCPSVGCLFTFNSDTITNSNRIFGNANNELIIWGYKAGQKAQMIFNYDVYSPAFDTTIYTLNR